MKKFLLFVLALAFALASCTEKIDLPDPNPNPNPNPNPPEDTVTITFTVKNNPPESGWDQIAESMMVLDIWDVPGLRIESGESKIFKGQEARDLVGKSFSLSPFLRVLLNGIQRPVDYKAGSTNCTVNYLGLISGVVELHKVYYVEYDWHIID